jgi:formate hydrogenlyase subunit 4
MLSIFLILLAACFYPGLILRVKSVASGRKGPTMLQPLSDLLRLFRKSPVYSQAGSFILRIAPVIYFSSVIMAMLIVPFGDSGSVISFNGDFVFFAYLLGAGRFFSILGAMDTGSSFEGMGSGREALYSMLIEPAFFILMGSLALLSGHTSFQSIFTSLHIGSHISYALAALATFVLLMISMVENSRMPIDDPKTHLELTMVHEVMILDNSGFDLGLILAAGYLKFAIYGALIVNLFIGMVPYQYSIPAFFVFQGLLAAITGIIESFMARFRMGHNAQFVFVLTSVSLLIFFGVLLILGKFN